MKKIISVLLFLGCFLGILLPIISGYPSNPTLASAWTDSPYPTIDGYIDPSNEWGNANSYLMTYTNGTQWGPYTLYIMNNATHLFLMWQNTTDELIPPGQQIYFDQGNDGIGEDMKDLFPSTGLGDRYWNLTYIGWHIDPATKDGIQETNPDRTCREVCIPLNSGDPYDMAVSPGDTVGFMSEIGGGSPVWPAGADRNEATTWGNLVLAERPTEGAVPEFDVGLPIITSIALAAYLLTRKRLIGKNF